MKKGSCGFQELIEKLIVAVARAESAEMRLLFEQRQAVNWMKAANENAQLALAAEARAEAAEKELNALREKLKGSPRKRKKGPTPKRRAK